VRIDHIKDKVYTGGVIEFIGDLERDAKDYSANEAESTDSFMPGVTQSHVWL
jgi:hypothetical protein